jgi:hypothetical protein
MATARPELIVTRALVPEEVAAAMEGAIRLYAPQGSGIDLGIDHRLIERWRRAFESNLSQRALLALKQPVVTCLERGELKGTKVFLEGVEHTASRAALLMCGDVRIADRGLAEADTIVEMSYRRRARELMLFVVSTEYAALREAIGVSLPRKVEAAGRVR